MDASEQLDDLLVYTIPNHHPPKMDVLPKCFSSNHPLSAKWLVRHSSTSPLPSLMYKSFFYASDAVSFAPLYREKYEMESIQTSSGHKPYTVHCTVYFIITPPVQFVVIFVCFSSFPVLPLGAMDSKSLGAETDRTGGKVYSNIQNISLYLYISNNTN